MTLSPDDPGAIGKHYCVEKSSQQGGVQFDHSATIRSIREARPRRDVAGYCRDHYEQRDHASVCVIGSPEVTPNSKLPSIFDNAREAAMPSASRNAANLKVLRRKRRCNSAACCVGSSGWDLRRLAITRLLTKWLFGVSATDPVTIVLVPLAILIVICLGCLLPASEAARVDPIEALRRE